MVNFILPLKLLVSAVLYTIMKNMQNGAAWLVIRTRKQGCIAPRPTHWRLTCKCVYVILVSLTQLSFASVNSSRRVLHVLTVTDSISVSVTVRRQQPTGVIFENLNYSPFLSPFQNLAKSVQFPVSVNLLG